MGAGNVTLPSRCPDASNENSWLVESMTKIEPATAPPDPPDPPELPELPELGAPPPSVGIRTEGLPESLPVVHIKATEAVLCVH